jgi:hypothetical protein
MLEISRVDSTLSCLHHVTGKHKCIGPISWFDAGQNKDKKN